MHSRSAITLVLLAVLLTGCVSRGTVEQPDAFVSAAVSWEGQQIREMISVWGPPTQDLVEPSPYMNGMAIWQYDEMEEPNPYAAPKTRTSCSGQMSGQDGNVSVDCSTYDANAAKRQSYELGRQAGAMFRKRCFVSAEFDEEGTILRVQASSQNCSTNRTHNLVAPDQ